jgi:hypothetical protein
VTGQLVLTPTFEYRHSVEEVTTGVWCELGVEKPHITEHYHDHARIPTEHVSRHARDNVERHAE